MPSPADVFKAYDIRGLSPGELNIGFAERLGQVLAAEFRPKTLLVGRDMRTTSPELEQALIGGLTASGVNVVRIGLCSTPLFNVSVGLGGDAYDLGVMVTASHNPAQYNGFKLVKRGAVPIGQGSGMELIRDRFVSDEVFMPASIKGGVSDDPHALQAYLDRIFSLVDAASLPPMTIGVDAGNGMAGVLLPEIAKRLPQIRMLPLYWDPDGTFPHHEANPLKTETLHDLSALVTSHGCAFGVAFDGDADRVGFVDEAGVPIPGDLLTALFSRVMLSTHPSAKILYDLRSSWSTPEVIAAAGGTPTMCRVGHAFIKKQMREEDAIFGGELSMHFYFHELWNVESTDLCLLLMLRLAASGAAMSTVWATLKKYAKTEEINSEVKDRDGVLKKIEETFAPSASSVSHLDGIRMEFGVGADGVKSPEAWWFSVRASNTEPLIRLIVEAVSPEVMAKKRDELLALIRG
jgi:phosphomannomutase